MKAGGTVLSPCPQGNMVKKGEGKKKTVLGCGSGEEALAAGGLEDGGHPGRDARLGLDSGKSHAGES